jgi:hypothetical protein
MHLKNIAIGACLVTSLCLGASPSTAPSDFVSAGKQTQAKLATTTAAWNTAIDAGNAILQADVIQSPEASSMRFSVVADGKTIPIGSLIERGGFWYVDDMGAKAKFRPYEAPFAFSNVYLAYELAKPRFVQPSDARDMGQCTEILNGMATFRAPLAPQARDQILNVLSNFNAAAGQNPKILDNPGLRQQVKQLNDLLANGVLRRIDTTLGIISETHTAKLNVRTSGFHWLESAQPPELNIDGVKWIDLTSPLVSQHPEDLIMISNSFTWKPPQPAGDMNACILDLDNTLARRIPFHGVQSGTGCFSKDRQRVYVTAADIQSGAMPLYEIDLQTGENRRLGGDLLATGMSMLPVLSPDGKTLVVSHKDLATGEILEWDVCLVDIASGNAKVIGKPIDAAFFSWLPDQNGFIVDVRKSVDMNKPSQEMISRMDLDGKITPIHGGSQPLLLADGKTILYEDQADRLWKTCDLSGANEKPFGDGFPKHGFPALSPDGKRILFMKFDSTGPKPMIFNLGETAGKPATTQPGLWAMPAWQ